MMAEQESTVATSSGQGMHGTSPSHSVTWLESQAGAGDPPNQPIAATSLRTGPQPLMDRPRMRLPCRTLASAAQPDPARMAMPGRGVAGGGAAHEVSGAGGKRSISQMSLQTRHPAQLAAHTWPSTTCQLCSSLHSPTWLSVMLLNQIVLSSTVLASLPGWGPVASSSRIASPHADSVCIGVTRRSSRG